MKSLIFDIDGTLWDSRQLVAEGYNIQLEKEGLSHLAVTAEDLRPLFGKVMTEIADVILASIDPSERYELMERCMDTENKEGQHDDQQALYCRFISHQLDITTKLKSLSVLLMTSTTISLIPPGMSNALT
mgnify:CR=1 FL=1